ncbi:MAG: methyltransferase domain-containing protein [Alphaproteobacteria bacterium]|nr:methyltransferase domain-containing protein [Alphaproteobacteria bacterium]
MAPSNSNAADDPVQSRVAEHYARADLERTILQTLAASGKDIERLTLDDLSPVDELHIGGRQATMAFAEQIGFAPGMHLLDIGSGLGGPSRFFAATYGVRVTGIDLTEAFVATASALAQRVGLADRVSYRHASALALPFDSGAFDGAYMMHVGMNIEDKRTLFAEARRVLSSGATFAIYDIMRTGPGELGFPVFWASSPETSFVAPPIEYRSALKAAGFEIAKERDRGDFARAFFAKVKERAREGQGPTSVLARKDSPQRLANVAGAVDAGVIAPIEIIARAR